LRTITDVNRSAPAGQSTQGKEGTMSRIPWQNDVDTALAESRRSGKPVLIDFSAAPA
jgi:hypothetical protein